MHKHSKYLSIALFLLLIVPSACKMPWQDKPLPMDPELRMGKLDNGFTYYIRKNKTPEKKVTMYLAIKAGSILETDEQRGVAHFVEHMAFNGTKNFPNSGIPDYLEKAGVRFGADINANTGPDETIYQLPLPSEDPSVIQNGLQIIRDWAGDITFDPQAVEHERQVILEEKRAREGLNQRLQEKVIPIYTNQSLYGDRLPIGTDEVLNVVNVEQIKQFYKDWYRPNLQAILIVGDIDVDQMEKDVKAKFSDLKNPENEKERPYYKTELKGVDQFVEFIDPEIAGIELDILKKTPLQSLKTTSDLKAVLTQRLLEQMVSSRFRQIPLVTFSPITGGVQSCRISLVSKPGETEPGFKSLWYELRRMQEDGFLETELARAKKVYGQQMDELALEKDKTFSEVLLKGYLAHFIQGDVKMDAETEAQLSKELLADISLSDVNGLLQSYLTAGNRDILVKASATNKAFLPDEETILAWIEQTNAFPMTAFVDEISDLPILEKEPVGGKITSTENDLQTGLQTLVLSNGMKVILKKTDFQNDQILFKGYAEGGTSLYNDADFRNAFNAANIVATAGAGNLKSTQLNSYLSQQQIQVIPFINDNYQGFSGSATEKSLGAALELMYAYITEPRKDKESFDILITRTKEQLNNVQKGSSQLFMDSVSYILSGGNIRKKAQNTADIDAINLDRTLDIFKERFADASNFTFLFVGNIDLEKIKPVLEKYLASLPSTYKKEQFRDLKINIPEGKQERTIQIGNDQKASALIVYSGPFEYNNANSIKMNAIEENLKMALNERLRNKEGGSYTPNVQLATTKYPRARFSLVLSFDCAIAKVDKLMAAAQDEVNLLRLHGPSQDNLQKYKASRKVGIDGGMKNNAFWLDYLTTQSMNKEPLNEILSYNKDLDGLGSQAIKEAAATFIQPDKNRMEFILLPVKNK